MARELRCDVRTVDRYARAGYRDAVKLALFRERGRVWCRTCDVEAFRLACAKLDEVPPPPPEPDDEDTLRRRLAYHGIH